MKESEVVTSNLNRRGHNTNVKKSVKKIEKGVLFLEMVKINEFVEESIEREHIEKK